MLFPMLSCFISFCDKCQETEHYRKSESNEVKCCHNNVLYHFFDKDKLIPQKMTDRMRPENIQLNFGDSLKIEFTNIDAKNTCAISRVISARAESLVNMRRCTPIVYESDMKFPSRKPQINMRSAISCR